MATSKIKTNNYIHVYSVNLNSNVAAGKIDLYRNGNSIIAKVDFLKLASILHSDSIVTIGTIPTEYRPSNGSTIYPCNAMANGKDLPQIYIYILNDSGNIQIANTKDGADTLGMISGYFQWLTA